MNETKAVATPDYNVPQELSSLGERWMSEQWLLASGIVPESAADTLLMYAYAQPGVVKASIEIDRDDEHNGEHPKVTYKVKLDPVSSLKMEAVKKAQAMKEGITKKLALLALAKAGAPVAVRENIVNHAKAYLPAQYSVECEVLE